jgi:hypothetical protein
MEVFRPLRPEHMTLEASEREGAYGTEFGLRSPHPNFFLFLALSFLTWKRHTLE